MSNLEIFLLVFSWVAILAAHRQGSTKGYHEGYTDALKRAQEAHEMECKMLVNPGAPTDE